MFTSSTGGSELVATTGEEDAEEPSVAVAPSIATPAPPQRARCPLSQLEGTLAAFASSTGGSELVATASGRSSFCATTGKEDADTPSVTSIGAEDAGDGTKDAGVLSVAVAPSIATPARPQRARCPLSQLESTLVAFASSARGVELVATASGRSSFCAPPGEEGADAPPATSTGTEDAGVSVVTVALSIALAALPLRASCPLSRSDDALWAYA